jgi:hypothetical protein
LKLLPLALSMAAPATAQSLIDYDLVMQENADRVVVATDAEGRETRTLDMGNGVMISCGPDGCIGMDMTDKGALGCTFAIFTELQAFAQVCEGVLDADGKAAMTEAFDTVGQIVARNAVPPPSRNLPARGSGCDRCPSPGRTWRRSGRSVPGPDGRRRGHDAAGGCARMAGWRGPAGSVG